MHTKVIKKYTAIQKQKKKSWKNSSKFLRFIKLQITINLLLIQNIFFFHCCSKPHNLLFHFMYLSRFLSFYMSLKKDGGGKLRNSLWTRNHVNSYTLNPPVIGRAFIFPVCSLYLFTSLWFLFLPSAQEEEFLQLFGEKMAFICWPVSLLLTDLQIPAAKATSTLCLYKRLLQTVSHMIAPLWQGLPVK